MKAFISILVAASLLAVVFLPAGAQTCTTQYTVKAGDNLYRIGLTFGVPWPTIATANNLANPNLIFIGQVLCIPPANTGTPGTPRPTATGATATPKATATRTATAPAGASATPKPATPPPATPTAFVIPTFTIVGVVQNKSVTVRTANFPANQTFDALMGPFGSLGVGGFSGGQVKSGAGGVFTATLTIPTQLVNASQIAIRLQSASGYYSYNWFWNFTTSP